MFKQLTFSFQLYKPKKCAFPGCDRKLNSRGLCKAHYKQLMKGKPLKPIGREPSPSLTYPKEFTAWKAMRSRCYNPKHPSYKYCGARGMTVCDRWRKSFWNFFNDVGKAPAKIYSIDRINNDLGYFPSNVRWATPNEQAHNTRKCRWITFEGERMLVGDLATKVKISEKTLRIRIFKDGLTPKEAVELINQTKRRQKKRPRKALRRSFP